MDNIFLNKGQGLVVMGLEGESTERFVHMPLLQALQSVRLIVVVKLVGKQFFFGYKLRQIAHTEHTDSPDKLPVALVDPAPGGICRQPWFFVRDIWKVKKNTCILRFQYKTIQPDHYCSKMSSSFSL